MKFARIVFGLGCVLLISALLLFRSTTAALTTGGEERLFYFCHDAASGYHCMGIYPVPNDVACDCGNADALTCELYRAMAKSLTEDPSLLLHEPGVRRINSLLVEKATDGVRLLSVNR